MNISNKISGLSSLGIARKIGLSFTVLGILLAIVAGISFDVINGAKTDMDEVVNQYEPKTIVSLELSGHLQEASKAMGFYLLSREDSYRKEYEESLKKVTASLNSLKRLVVASGDAQQNEEIKSIENLVKRFISYKAQLTNIVDNQLENLAGVKYAAEHVNPATKEILLAIGSMLTAEQEEDSSAERREFLFELVNLRYQWSNLMMNLRSYMIIGDKSALENVNLYFEGFKLGIEKLSSRSDMFNFEQEDAFEQMPTLVENFKPKLDNLIAIFEGEKSRTDVFLLKKEIGPVLSEVDTILKRVVAREKGSIKVVSHSLLNKLSSGQWFIGALLIFGILLTIAVSFLMSRLIVKPLRIAVNAMHDIAEGDGDLTKRLEDKGNDELASMSKGFNAFAEKTQNIVRSSVLIVEEMDEKIHRLFDVSQEAQKRADAQQQHTEKVVQNVQQVSESVTAVGENAVLAVSAANSATEATAEGKQVLQETVNSIQSMAAGVEKASDAMRSLSTHAEKIGSVVDVIKGIAEQTNLLALNAAIEAARAGEQGRGFAVVADEVRTLATRTHESTDEIESMITTLQNDVGTAATTMENEREQANITVEQAEKTSSVFESIYNSVSSIRERNDAIDHAAQNQKTKAEQVAEIVETLMEIAEENAAGSQQTHSAANELTKLEVKLKQNMTQFKV